jgi:hypothetical protein
MIENDKVKSINDAMAAARHTFVTETQAADSELIEALARWSPTGDADANWNMVEAHNKYRNRIEAAAFALRLAFLKAAGRRE